MTTLVEPEEATSEQARERNARRGTTRRATAESAARGPAARAHRRAVHHGHLRRHRRSHRAQARAGALQLPARRLPATGVHRGRLRAAPADRPGVPRSPAGRNQQAQPQPSGQAGDLGVVRTGDRVPPGQLRRPGGLRRACEAARSDRPRPRHRRESALLPGRPAGALPGDRPPSRAGRPGRPRQPSPQRLEARLDARHRREAVRIGSRQRPAAQPRAGRRLQRGPGLPNRPLPGQGDRPEPRRLPLRERPVRADLEPPLHRLGPDHGRRDGRRRGTRRVLRRHRRPARHRPGPRTAADGDVRHGSAGRVPRGGPARREAEGAARREADVARRGGNEHGARPVRLGLGRGPEGDQLPGRAGGRTRLADRDVRCAQARDRLVALGRACRSTCAPARRCPAG